MYQKLNLLSLSIIIFSAAALSSCNNAEANVKKSDELLPVKISKINAIDTTIFHDFVGDVQAKKHVELRSKISGFLEKIHIDEGAVVKKGQLLFTINAADYKANAQKSEAYLSSALAQLKKAEIELEQSKLLHNRNIISRSELKMSEANYSAAQAAVAEARSSKNLANTELTYAQIRAPFTGRIDRLQLREGSLVTEGALLTMVSELDQVFVYFEISEKEYLNLSEQPDFQKSTFSKPVQLKLANGKMYEHEGVAEFAESTFDTQTGTIALRATFPNPDYDLNHGSSGTILVPTTVGEITVVHQKSVLEVQDRHFVFKLGKDNAVRMVPFKAGERVGHYYQVLQGLEIGDQVAFEGAINLKDGQLVKPVTLQ